MKQDSQWIIDGRKASRRDLMEAMALARQHRAKIAAADREARARDAAARAVGASLRRTDTSIGCRPRSVEARLDGSRQLNRLEKRFGLAMLKRAVGSTSGTSSFHFKLTARGLGAPRKAGGRRYRRGEIVGVINYNLRHSAREEDDQGIESNLSIDPDQLAAVFAALEELEIEAGRDNANVYMSLIVSLPAELTAQERKALLREVCAFLADHGLSYIGIQHKPDRDGDQRNFHAHVVFSWRPMELTTEGCAFSADTKGALNTPAFVTEFRAHAANAMNVAMQTAGHARRFTAERTRETHGSSIADKHGAGRKHRDRRAERIALAERQKAALEDRRSALDAAIGAVQGWIQRVVPDRRTIMTVLRARQAEILDKIAQREIAAALEMSAAEPLTVPLAPAVSHEKPAEAEVDAPMPARPPTPAQAVTAPIVTTVVTPDPEETYHADRLVYATALRNVRRHFAAREPDHRQPQGGGQTGPLSGVQQLSACGLARGLSGPKMLLHGLSPNLLGEAAGPAMGSGDGLRRPRSGDHPAERAPVISAPSEHPTEPAIGARTPTGTLPMVLKEKRPSTQTIDALRQAVRKRAERPRADATRLSTNRGKTLPAVEGGSHGRDDAARNEPGSAAPSAVPARSSQKPPTGDKVVPAKPQAPGANVGASRDSATRATHQAHSRQNRAADRAELDHLVASLSKRLLPLRETTEREGGRERTLYLLVPDQAAPKDAELVAQALARQYDAELQELFQRRFDALLATIRLTMESPVSATDRRLMLNPDNDAGFAAALAAAEGSPSFDALMAPLADPALDEGPDLTEQLLGRGSGRGQ